MGSEEGLKGRESGEKRGCRIGLYVSDGEEDTCAGG